MQIINNVVLALLGSGYLAGVLAGPGANVYACAQLSNKPSKPFTVDFDPHNGGSKCMRDTGSANSVQISDSGVTCASIGYVEAKVSSSGGDTCATDWSTWNLSYKTINLPSNKSGNIKSRWRKQWGSQTNEISFISSPKNSYVCGSSANCNSDVFTWDTGTTGPAYFIFSPDNQDGPSFADIAEVEDVVEKMEAEAQQFRIQDGVDL